MEKFRKTIYLTISVLTVIIALVTLLSIFRNTDNRFLKMFDFPRIQLFIVSLISFFLFTVLTKRWRWYDYALLVGLIGGLIINGNYLINYTPLVRTAVPTATEIRSGEVPFSLMLINVKMENRESQPLIDLVNEKQPDLLLAMEVDSWWDNELSPIEQNYPYAREVINEVAYGMVLYSKLPLDNVTVNYLQNENVPSIETTVEIAPDKLITLHAVHPVPPTYFKKMPDNAGQKEVEMLKIGKKVEQRTHPTVVAGDINDLVWSYTDDLTGTENLLHDVRVGRGFYNSFNAHNWFMRWPLDHVFVTKEVKLKKIEQLEKVGSDHFPVYVELVL